MNENEFIKQIAPIVQKYAPQYGIKVCSPIIAQACLESAYGKSSKAKMMNFFGLKYRKGRVSCHNGTFNAGSMEQNPNGSYVPISTDWYSFDSMDNGVLGYFQFINISRYANVKGVTDPRRYLEILKSDGYATSIDYVNNLMNVINKYDLTKYDSVQDVQKRKDDNMIINVHAGHNADGKIACGAIGLIKESTEARKVKDEVIRQLKALGHTVYDCTVDDAKNVSANLSEIVAKCNKNNVDLDVSIHFNGGANDKTGNGKSCGTEVLVYSESSKANTYAKNVCEAIASLGFTNRGVKVRNGLYVLRHTNAPAMLIECCFVDDADDIKLYNYKTMASAIVKGITGQTFTESTEPSKTSSKVYKVQCGAFKKKKNAEALKKKLKAAGFDATIV